MIAVAPKKAFGGKRWFSRFCTIAYIQCQN